MPKEVTRTVSPATQYMLWGKAAGRCEFAGCNKRLWQSNITKEQVNIAQKAHIWAFSSGGPRGNDGIPDALLNNIENLMLVCHECHTLIDQDDDGEKYSVQILESMKAKHEQRIELATSISPEMQSNILMYGANIGEQSSPLTFTKAANALFPDRYPADSTPINLGLNGSPFQDHTEHYWLSEKRTLEENFERLVRPKLKDGYIEHLSVFGIAPQPLLIRLGSLLTDIPAADVYQLHREHVTWSWNYDSKTVNFIINKPKELFPIVALNFSLSATIDDSRIHAVIGKDISIWTITLENTHNDCVQSKEDLSSFRKIMRNLYDQIKLVHGENCNLHIFPAVPVSIAIEIGRVRMPKTAINLHLYDEQRNRGGFIHAFDI